MATPPVSPGGGRRGGGRVPFYRNVKTLGVLAQVVFALAVAFAAGLVYHNVSTALARSHLPADFSFLGVRAGIPIAETPIHYTPSDSYARAFLIGVLNTLKVALVGVVLASLLGLAVGVMRLSANWLLRQLANLYVETIRNTPLAVQIVFWYTAILTPLPPRVLSAVRWPGGVLVSNQGVALPWPYPSPYFHAWIPYLVGALAVAAAVYLVWRRRLRRFDRPGNPLGPALLALAVVAAAGYFIVGRGGLPQGATTSFRQVSGVATAFVDANGDGTFQAGERTLPFTPLVARVPEGVLTTQTQDLSESRHVAYARFRFPPIRDGEYDKATVTFANPSEATGLAIHFLHDPYQGIVYRDANGNGRFDSGEELRQAGANPRGYAAQIRLKVEGFHRRLVTDRDGQARIPRFTSGAGGQSSGGGGANVSPAQLFAAPTSPKPESAAMAADFELQPARPVVLSHPSIPISTYFGGISLSTNYLALLLGLVIYTASFIAEIVRGGIQAVPLGQREAAKALGLSDLQTFRLVIFPQALRIILPPMISQYLNLTKNSSLAPLAAYVELFAITTIIASQTGASVPVTIMLIASYIVISLVFAFVLNIVNARLALVER
ncbi:MAG TPA: ABC transporter permease subunit [Trueperaceae bacterium]|nr:ABC transporter permease subunit [Trueperaceae bacterium]